MIESFYVAVLAFLRKEREALVDRIYKGACTTYDDYKHSCRCVAYLELIEDHCRKTYRKIHEDDASPDTIS